MNRVKCYVCLFTCSTTHNLEIVDDMTTDQFLLAFRRHCALYGTPSLILCDNAKTFQKGNEEIQKLFQVIEDQTVQDHLCPEESSDETHSCQVTTLGRHV